jgi:hypothetical protein
MTGPQELSGRRSRGRARRSIKMTGGQSGATPLRLPTFVLSAAHRRPDARLSANALAPESHAPARAVARYHAGCLRVIGAQNVALRDVRTTKKAALCCDLSKIAGQP